MKRHLIGREGFLMTSAGISLSDAKRTRREVLRRLWLRGRPPTEGSSSPAQLLCLARAAKGAHLVAEIGFNAGLSSHAFLNAGARVISFDLGDGGCTKPAKKLIDKKFPARHTLIYGDSRETVPEFKDQNPGCVSILSS
jgi:predicted O-methyltransferase YrrM